MIDIDVVVDLLDSAGLVRKGKISGDWYQIHCPFHNDGQERRPSCGVARFDQVRSGQQLYAGTFHCFACGAVYSLENGITKILQSKGISQTGKQWLSSHFPGYSEEDTSDSLMSNSLFQSLASKYAVNYVESMTQGPKAEYVSEEELASYRYVVPYMYERKLTDDVIQKYDVGYDANWIPPGRKNKVPCITFPVRDKEGNTLFLCRRSIKGKFFNYPEHVIKPVYGIDMIPKHCKSIIICESIINALTLVTYGFPAVALLGTGNPYQIQQLKELGVDEFVLCFDGDEAGQRGTSKMKKALRSCAVVWTIHMEPGKDANDLDKETFMKLYEERD